MSRNMVTSQGQLTFYIFSAALVSINFPLNFFSVSSKRLLNILGNITQPCPRPECTLTNSIFLSTYFPFPLDKLYLPHSILNYIISSFLQLLHSFIVRDFTIEILPSFIRTDNCQFLSLSRFIHSSVILPCYLLWKTSFFLILHLPSLSSPFITTHLSIFTKNVTSSL